MQDIRRQIGTGLRWLPLIVVVALVAGLVAYSFSSSQPNVYEATAKLAVDPGQGITTQDEALARSAAARYAEQAVSRPVLQAVINRLALDESVKDLEERIETSVGDETIELIIDARGPEPADARTLASAVGNVMRERVRDSLLTDQVKAADEAIQANQTSIRVLENRLRNLRNKRSKTNRDWDQIALLTAQISALQRDVVSYRPASSAFIGNLLRWSERPILPEEPVEPRPLYWTMLAVVAGGMLAAGTGFTLEYLRSMGRIREDRDLELATGLATLGAVTESSRDARKKDPDRLVTLRYPRSDEAEAYRGLIAKVGFSGASSRTIMVTSPGSGDAKSVVAANVAVAYAESGRNVILVDADYRTPRVHRFFGVSNERGLTTILTDSATPLGFATVPSPHPRLGLMPSGPLPLEAADPLGERQIVELLRRLLQAADIVVFDSPALASSLDAAVLAAEADGAILVVPHDSKEADTVEAARDLHAANTEFIGAVMYRTGRGSRKGTAVKVPPAPKGWGATWPMFNDQPAQITAAAAGASSRGKPATSRPAPPPANAPRQPRPTGAPAGPYATPFTARPTQAGSATPPRSASGSAAPTTGLAGPTTTAPSAPPAAAAPSTARSAGGIVSSPGRAPAAPSGPAEPTSPRPQPQAAPSAGSERVAIPVQPDEAAERTDKPRASTSVGGNAGTTPGTGQARPESIPG